MVSELRNDIVAHLGLHLFECGRVGKVRRGVIGIIDGDGGVHVLLLRHDVSSRLVHSLSFDVILAFLETRLLDFKFLLAGGEGCFQFCGNYFLPLTL